MPELCLEVEFLTGRYVAADPFARELPEWPPAPARVFAALAAAAFEDEAPDALEALRWLESLPAPSIRAQPLAIVATPRQAAGSNKPPIHFVPVNDTSMKHGSLVREGRQPRPFPSLALAEPRVHFLWSDTPDAQNHIPTLTRLAALVPYIGESASVTRLTWRTAAGTVPNLIPHLDGEFALRVPTCGQTDRFADNFKSGRAPAAGVQVRYAKREALSYPPAFPPSAAARVEPFIFRLEGSPSLCVTHALHLTAAIRRALVALAGETAHPVPPVLHGHANDGGRLRQDHGIVVPLPHVTGPHASGRIIGFGVLLPRTLPASDRQTSLLALGALKEVRFEGGNCFPVIRCGRWEARRTLQLSSWAGPARVWITVTPAVLSRFPGKRPDKSPSSLVKTMCRHVGLPEPAAWEFRGASFAPGIPHARAYLARRPHWRPLPYGHLRLEFAEPVTGPLVIGSCRHYGLGLLLPLLDEFVAASSAPAL